MKRPLLWTTLALLVLSAARAAAFDIPTNQVMIESRVVVTDQNFFKEVGVNFGFGLQDSRRPDFDFAPLRENNQPTGGFLFSFDSASFDPSFQLFIDLVSRPVRVLSAPSVIRLSAGARRTQLDLDQDIPEIQIPGGQQAGVVSLDGQQFQNINNPTQISFDQSERFVEAGGAIALQSQLGGPFQLQTALLANYLGIDQTTEVSLLNQGNPLNEKSELEARGAVLSLKVTPIVQVNGQVNLSLSVEAGATILDADFSQRRIDNQAVTVANGQTTIIGGVFGVAAGVNVRPFEGLGSSLGLTGEVRHLTDVPFIGHAFRDGQGTEIGSQGRTELVVMVTARIVTDDFFN